jgi:hypothetical protein
MSIQSQPNERGILEGFVAYLELAAVCRRQIFELRRARSLPFAGYRQNETLLHENLLLLPAE